jgi:hypothetical protein
MKKTYDLAVKTGSYKDKNGDTKNRYENIGTVVEGDNGPYIIMKRTFNPAGVPNPENRDTIVVSMFTPKDGNSAPASAPAQQQTNAAPSGDPANGDDIPF